MSNGKASKLFVPYTELKPFLPDWFWQGARIAALAVTLWVLVLLVVNPELGLTIFWRLVIPSLPLVFALVPGIWRQICPMAFLNQIPVRNGFSAGRTLPKALKESSYLFALIAFVGLVTLKHVTFYSSSTPLLLLLVAALGAAFVGGLIFKGRSGWCGTFCPLGPLQKVYGHAPVALVKNGYCNDGCVGCQKNCYDFSPRSAFFEDLSDKDPWYAGHRRVHIGVLPGLVLSFWLGHSPEVIGYGAYLQDIAFWLIGSAGSFFILTSILRNSVYKVAAVYGIVALFLYYWFAAPVILGGLRDVFDISLPDILANILQVVVVVVAARNLHAGLQLEKAYAAFLASGGKLAEGLSATTAGANGDGSAQAAPHGVLHERASGKSIEVDPGKTVLELFEDAGIGIDFGCRTGMCGADPIFIEDGDGNLTPPSQTELETLRRLGLEGKARMACACKVRRGPVTVNLAADLASAAASAPNQPADDLAALAGIERIVVVGNGVAGVTAVDRLRQASPSVHIDLLSRENHHYYNRMAIGRAIYGRTALDGLDLLPPDWFKKNDITVWLNTVVSGIDRSARTVQLGTGQTLGYDKLLLATGGRATKLPVPGRDLPGSFVLREAGDALEIRAYRQRHGCKRAVVIGGGVLGVEAADALWKLGLDVTIVHRDARLMDRNLDQTSSAILADFLEASGFALAMESEVVEIGGAERVSSVTLSDGRTLEAEICVHCIGVTGETDLAVRAGLDVNRGIVVDAMMRTSDPDIYAIGDVAEFGDGPSGLWTLGTQHAQLATDHILNRREGSSVPRTVVRLKVDDIDVVAYGEVQLRRLGQEEIIDSRRSDHIHRRLLVENGRIASAFFVGPPGTARGVVELIRDDIDITPMLPELRRGNWEILGRDISELTSVGQPAEAKSTSSTQAVSTTRPRGQHRIAWAAGLVMGIGLAIGAAMMLGAEPDEKMIDAMKHQIEDALEPKRRGVDATARFGVPIDAGTTNAPAPDLKGEQKESAAGSASSDATGSANDSQTGGPVGTGDGKAGDGGAGQPASGQATPSVTDGSSEAEDGPPAGRTAQAEQTDQRSSADQEGAGAGQGSGQAAQPPSGTPTASTSKTGANAGATPETSGADTAKPVAPAAEGTIPSSTPASTSAEPADANGNLTSDEISSELAGRTVRGGRDFGARNFVVRFDASGAATAEISQGDSFGTSAVDTGRWTTSNDQLCLRFAYLQSGRRVCAVVSREGGRLIFRSPDGRDRGWTVE